MKQEEMLLRAIGDADDQLIAGALELPAKKRPAVLRWAAVAACVCLLLASPVGAAMTDTVFRFLGQSGRMEHYVTDRICVEDLSDQAIAAFPETEGTTNYLEMGSIGEAEEFLGIELPDNSVLDGSERAEFEFRTETMEIPDCHCIVRLITGDRPVPYCADASAAYRIDGIFVEAMYRCTTELNPYENGGGVGFDQAHYEAEEYTAQGGRTWYLYIDRDDGSGALNSAQVIGNVNGILTWIQVWTIPEYYPEEALRTMLTDIVEAYA